MKGRLIQISNIDGESIGLWYTESLFPNKLLLNIFRDFDDSEIYDEEGIDGFEEYFRKQTSFFIERVFIEEEFL